MGPQCKTVSHACNTTRRVHIQSHTHTHTHNAHAHSAWDFRVSKMKVNVRVYTLRLHRGKTCGCAAKTYFCTNKISSVSKRKPYSRIPPPNPWPCPSSRSAYQLNRMCVYLTLPYLTWYVRTLSVHNASLIYWKFIQPLKTAGIGLTHSTGPINAALLYLLSAQPPFTTVSCGH